MAEPKPKKRGLKQKLIDNAEEEGGISNPTLDTEIEAAYQTFSHTEGESSAAELIEENEQAEVLKGELKSRHRRRRRELSKLVSPKDDLTGELKTVKLESRKKIDETQQEDELAQALAEAGAAVEEDQALEAFVPQASGDAVLPPELEEEKPEEKVPEEDKQASPAPQPEVQEEIVKAEVQKTEEIVKEKEEEEPKPAPERRRSTMRERMKSRLAKAKEEAESELEKEERDERKKILKGKKETRFVEDHIQMDEEEVARLEARTANIRKQRLERAKQHEALSFMPTQEEALDFFTREWEPEPAEVQQEEAQDTEEEAEPKPETPEGEEEESEEQRAAKQEEKKEEDKLLEDDDDYTPEGYGPVAIRKATIFDPEVMWKAEQENLFYPSSVATPASKKVDDDLEPRFLEDEGFYVGVKPTVARKNMSKMENRLLKEAENSHHPTKWFGEDGQMIVLPDPLRETPVRPALFEEDAPYLDVVFQKAIMREFDSRYIDGTVEGGGFYQLDVDINSIAFTHHHLFSREHVLAYKLSSLYEEYLTRRKRNMTEFLIEKLMALKHSARLLHDYILAHKGEMSVSDRDNYERRLRDYKSEIRLTRAMRDQEEQTDRTVLKAIINSWKEMKALREQQNYINTPLKLQLRKEETNKSEDLLRWKAETEEEIKEEKEFYEEEVLRKEAVYKAESEKYEKQQKDKEEAAKRIAERVHQRRGSKASKGSKNSKNSQETLRADPPKNEEDDDGNEEENERDQEIIDEEPLDKPEPPEPFNEQAVKERVKAKALAQKRRPGEPKLYPEVTNTATVTPTNQCSKGEQQRRDDVSKCKIFVKILFNGKEVSRSGQRPLSQDFKVNFGQIYNLKIVEWPDTMRFEVYESLGFGSGRMLAEIFAPIPESSVTSQSVTLENIEFSSFEKIQFSHEGVGSGFAFKFEGHVPDLVTLMTTGILNSSVAWAIDEDGVPLVPIEKFGAGFQAAMQLKRLDPFAAIGASGVGNIEKLLKWFKDSRLDPNDPNNKDIVYMLSGNDQNLLQPREYFRLEPLQEEFDFVTQEELNANPRFKMITLRNEEHPLFKGYQMIPVHEKELPRDIFKVYKQKMKEETTLPQVKGDLDQHRAQVNQYLQQIKDRVMTQYKFASHQKSLQDMINEDLVPNISMLATSLLRLSEPRRPLKPVRKERKKVTAQALDGKEVKILINIIRASYIPVRKHINAAQTGGREEAKSETSEELVCPYFEVMFQRSRVRTRRGEGPNPSFNEELELTLKVPNDDYSPSALQTIEDIVYLNLFDEVTVDVLEDNRERATNVHQRIEKKWLGSIKIPFSTIYFNNKIDGTFKLNTPPFMLGYTQDVSQMQPAMSEVETSIHKGQVNTYVSMFVTVEPSLTLPEPFKEKLASNEEEDLLHYAEQWQAKLENKFPKRIFKTTVMDTSGKNVFITRYFRSLKPPPEIEACTEPAKTMELTARYVSLIPFVADTTLFPGQCDIWSTCSQFMRMLCGDEEEHAVLLTNFLLGLGKNAWLLLGNAVPEGETAYVLTEENGFYTLWNPRSGEKFKAEDNYCPIQVVGCLINAENIWANIQQYEKPTQMDFNVTNTSKWQPFYTRSFPARGLASIQPAQLVYKRKDKKFSSLVVELQERIEQMLKNKIMEWRTRYITRWNRHCTQIMRKLLPLLEENCGRPIDQSSLKDLEDSFKSYKVSGFPLNMPYSDLNAITEAVFSTGVHAQETSDVEFALAVHVEGYTNNVMSIWIYVASLVRLR